MPRTLTMAAMDEPAVIDAVAFAAASRFGSGERAIVPTMNLEKGDYEVLKAAFLAQPILFFLQVRFKTCLVCAPSPTTGCFVVAKKRTHGPLPSTRGSAR